MGSQTPDHGQIQDPLFKPREIAILGTMEAGVLERPLRAEGKLKMTAIREPQRSQNDLGARADTLYAQLRPQVETPENIGKLIVMDVESGDYEIDEMGIETSRRLQERHPGATLYAFRIGYKAVEALGGVLERLPPQQQ